MSKKHWFDRFVVLAFAFTFVAFGVGCPPTPPPVVPPPDAADAAPSPPPETPDAAPIPVQDASLDSTPAPVAKDSFDDACLKLASLKCPEAAQVDGGRTCASTMRANALLYDTRPGCLALAKTAAEVRACCPSGKFNGVACSPVRCLAR